MHPSRNASARNCAVQHEPKHTTKPKSRVQTHDHHRPQPHHSTTRTNNRHYLRERPTSGSATTNRMYAPRTTPVASTRASVPTDKNGWSKKIDANQCMRARAQAPTDVCVRNKAEPGRDARIHAADDRPHHNAERILHIPCTCHPVPARQQVVWVKSAQQHARARATHAQPRSAPVRANSASMPRRK